VLIENWHIEYDKFRLLSSLDIRPSEPEAIQSLTFNPYYEKLIGLLDVELFVPILSYVFGEARQGGNMPWFPSLD